MTLSNEFQAIRPGLVNLVRLIKGKECVYCTGDFSWNVLVRYNLNKTTEPLWWRLRKGTEILSSSMFLKIIM